MELVSLSMYTIDTKGGKILELNDGVYSDIETLDRHVGGDAIGQLVLPWVQDMQPLKDVVYMRPQADMAEYLYDVLKGKPHDWDGVIVSGFCQGGTEGLSQIGDRPFKLTNGDYVDLALFRNKGFVADVAKLSGAACVPRTAHYTTTFNEDRIDDICRRIEKDFSGARHLVLKPLDGSKGEGVVIIDAKNAKQEFVHLFTDLTPYHRISNRYNDSGFAEEYWRKKRPDVFQVQEFVEDTPVQHKSKKWDGTRRYLCATMLQKDESGALHAQTVVFGGFVKLPRMPLSPGGDVDHKSRISFSYPYGGSERLKRFFGLALPGSGDQIIIPRNQAVAETLQICGDLDRLFVQARTMDIRKYIRAGLKSDDDAQRLLAEKVKNSLPEENTGKRDRRTPPRHDIDRTFEI